MKTVLHTLVMPLLFLSSLAVIEARAADAKPCPISAESLSAQLGTTFKVVSQGRAIIGQGCEYQDATRTVKISLDAGPNPVGNADAWRKMSQPPGTTWRAIPNDPDKAVVIASSPNGTPEPHLSYERKGTLVSIVVLTSDPASYPAWTDKLVKLKRIPE